MHGVVCPRVVFVAFLVGFLASARTQPRSAGAFGWIPNTQRHVRRTHRKGLEICSRNSAIFQSFHDQTSESVLVSGTQSRQRRSPGTITTCSTVHELVAAIDGIVEPHHRVLELGAQLRNVSTSICKILDHTVGGSAVLVDVSRNFPHESMATAARTRNMRQPGAQEGFYPKVVEGFVELDDLDSWRNILVNSTGTSCRPFDVLVLNVDSIVGNDLEWTSLSIAREFLAWNSALGHEEDSSSARVLVRSASLNRMAATLIHGGRYTVSAALEPKGPSPPSPRWIATQGVQEYRATISDVVLPGDSVLEIGCHFGTTTALLHNATGSTGHCMGVDVGNAIIAGARERYSHVHFKVGDAWKPAEILRMQQAYFQEKGIPSNRIGMDVIYVDVGGLSGKDGLQEALILLSTLQACLEPKVIVIKSLCMRRLAATLVSHWQWQQGRKDLLRQRTISHE